MPRDAFFNSEQERLPQLSREGWISERRRNSHGLSEGNMARPKELPSLQEVSVKISAGCSRLQNADYVLAFKTGGSSGIPHSINGGKRGLFGSEAPTTAGIHRYHHQREDSLAACPRDISASVESPLSLTSNAVFLTSSEVNLQGRWAIERLRRLMAILKDVDILPPVQSMVTVGTSTSVPGPLSLVMKDLLEYVTLAFLVAFDAQPQPIAMPLRPFRRESHTWPSRRRTCPNLLNSSRSGLGLSLVIQDRNEFLGIIKECTPQIKAFGDTLPDERVEGSWRQILAVFRGSVLVD
ncbi:hypothetical protein FA13DRAFT_1711849 [Coprinellus micaceus]|uniref:Uncharacterized protein n=1 Tax=Coprinellus micaceus TaxID=71717 RepID=A0A4Y7T361_COPMI|nr:hypothetical protein FA13DRAFT_1711849 [Coprinellus micaceus]